MDEYMRAKIALGIFMIFLVKGYADLFRTKKSKKEIFMDRAKERGDFVEAVKCKSWIKPGDRNSNKQSRRTPTYIVTYEYFVGGERYTKTLHFQSPGMAGCDYPGKITVYYDRNNPKKAYSKNDINETVKKNAGCFGTILKGFIAMFLVIHGLGIIF